MINKIILALLLFVAHLEGFDEVTEDEQHYLEVFFAKYCNETDEEILDKLQKCEAKNPIEVSYVHLLYTHYDANFEWVSIKTIDPPKIR